jgi:hypothetical protein
MKQGLLIVELSQADVLAVAVDLLYIDLVPDVVGCPVVLRPSRALKVT